MRERQKTILLAMPLSLAALCIGFGIINVAERESYEAVLHFVFSAVICWFIFQRASGFIRATAATLIVGSACGIIVALGNTFI